MDHGRRHRGGTVWRRVFAPLAAYLFVMQAALAGGAIERMAGPDAMAVGVICLNGETGAPDAPAGHSSTFDCCGIGCVVSAHGLAGPASPTEGLTYPAARAFAAAPMAQASRPGAAGVRNLRLRGPPAAG